MPIALSTYRFPRTHPGFPFSEFLEQCDLAMPQVYFEQAHNVEEQLERCVQQYLALKPARPIIPTGPTYSHGGWRPTAGEVERFLVRAKAMGLTAANFWAYDFSTRPSFHDLWDAIAAFDWPAGPPVADMPERLVGRINQKDAGLISGLCSAAAAALFFGLGFAIFLGFMVFFMIIGGNRYSGWTSGGGYRSGGGGSWSGGGGGFGGGGASGSW